MNESSTEQQKDGPKSGLGGSATRPAPGETAQRIESPPQPPQGAGEGKEPQPGEHLPHGAPEGLKQAAGGVPSEPAPDDKVGQAQAAAAEKGALDFMLSNPDPAPFHSDVLVGTPAGLKKLRFHMHQLDGSRIETLETEHSNGVGPFATVDRYRLNCAKIAEATDKMVDENGKELTPIDSEFLRDAIAPPIAFERMFKYEPGVAEQLGEQIDRMAGMTRDRVGAAEREMTTAVGNS